MLSVLYAFKDYKVAGTIRGIMGSIAAKQAEEYPDEIQAYFQGRQDEGLPFPEDFSQEPDPIQHVKLLFNGLYYLEQTFLTLESTPDVPLSQLPGVLLTPEFINIAYAASICLTEAGAAVMKVFEGEIAGAWQYITAVHQFTGKYTPGSEQASKLPKYIRKLGRGSAEVVSRLGPDKGMMDYDFVKNATTVIPHQIEVLRLQLESYTPTVKKHAPHANYEKMAALNQRGTELAETVSKSKDVLGLLMNSLRLLNQMGMIISDVMQEVGYLDDSMQHLVLTNLATFKYRILPQIFAFIDKFEMQMMCEPGRFSKPLMVLIKPYYEYIVGWTRLCVEYEGDAARLLQIEDSHFIKHRLEPINRDQRDSKLTLQQLQQAIARIDTCIAIAEGDYDSHQEKQKDLEDAYVLLTPYLDLLGDQLRPMLDMDEPSVGGMRFVDFFDGFNHLSPAQRIAEFQGLRAILTQMQADQRFRIEQQNKMKDAVHEHAHLTLLPETSPSNPFELSEPEVLSRRHLTREALEYDEDVRQREVDAADDDEVAVEDVQPADDDEDVVAAGVDAAERIDIDDLTSSERWDLYAAYRDSVESLDKANRATERLLERLDADNCFEADTLRFARPELVVGKDPLMQHYSPSILEIHVGKETLRYNLKKGRLEGDGQLYLTSLQEASRLGHRDCYVLDRERHQLYHIPAKGDPKGPLEYSITGEKLETVDVPESYHVKRNKVFFKGDRELRFLFGSPANLPDTAHEIGLENAETVDKDHAIFLWLDDGELQYKTYVPSDEGCKLYYNTTTDEVRAQGLHSCYVFEPDTGKLSYVTSDGSIKRNIASRVFLDHIPTFPIEQQEGMQSIDLTSEEIQTYITNESGHVPMVSHTGSMSWDIFDADVLEEDTVLSKMIRGMPLDNDEERAAQAFNLGDLQPLLPRIAEHLINQAHIGNPPEQKVEIVDDPDTRLDSPAVYFHIAKGQLYYNVRTRSEAGCKLYVMSLDEACKAGHVDCYVWNQQLNQMNYIAPDGRIQRNIKFDSPLLKAFLKVVKKRSPEAKFHTLTPEQIARIITHVGDHYPVQVKQGYLPLKTLNCPLKKLKDLGELNPYLPRVFAILAERGDIKSSVRHEVIGDYARLQPYLRGTPVERYEHTAPPPIEIGIDPLVTNTPDRILAPDTIYFMIDNGELHYTLRTKKAAASVLFLKTLDEARAARHRDCYVWDQIVNQMHYIASDGRIERDISCDFDGIHELINARIPTDLGGGSYLLAEEYIDRLITHVGGHAPLAVIQGQIPLTQINCPLTQITDVTRLGPYLPRIFARLAERDDIKASVWHQVISDYVEEEIAEDDAFQDAMDREPGEDDNPVVEEDAAEDDHAAVAEDEADEDRLQDVVEHGAEEADQAVAEDAEEDQQAAIEDQATVDTRVVHAFMGIGNTKATDRDLLRSRLVASQAYMAEQRAALDDKQQALLAGLEHPEISPDMPEVSLQAESAILSDIAQFLPSQAPLERKISNARKDLFKLNILLGRQDIDETDRRRLTQRKIRLLYVIQHHEQLLAEFQASHPRLDYDPENRLVKRGLLHHAPTYKTEYMGDDFPAPNRIQLKIEAGMLQYRLQHYGEFLEGVIPLADITPPIRRFDQHTVLTPRKFASVLDKIYEARARAVEDDPNLLCPEEALDLYRWYERQQDKVERAHELYTHWYREIERIENSDDCPAAVRNQYDNLKPVLLAMVKPPESVDTFEKAFVYCKANDLKTVLTAHNATIRFRCRAYHEHARVLLDGLDITSMLPHAPAPTDPARENYLLKHKACSEALGSLEAVVASLANYMSPALQARCQPTKKSLLARTVPYADQFIIHVPFPELNNLERTALQPKQALAYKRLSNLVYALKHVMLEIEKMNASESKYFYVKQGVYAYLYVAEARKMCEDLMADPYTKAYVGEIMEQASAVYKSIMGHLEQYEPTEGDYQSKLPRLMQGITALYELPDQIRQFRSNETDNGEQEPDEDELDQADEGDDEAEADDVMPSKARQAAGKTAEAIDKLYKRARTRLRKVKNTHRFFEPAETSGLLNWGVASVKYISMSIAGMPLLAQATEVRRLLKVLQERLDDLAHASHDKVLEELGTIRKDYLNRIILAVDAFEDQSCLQPGLLSKPVSDICDQFYLGLITPLVDTERAVALMRDQGTLFDDRVAAANERLRQANVTAREHQVDGVTPIKRLIQLYESTKYLSGPRAVGLPGSFNRSFTALKASYTESLGIIRDTLLANDEATQFPSFRHLLEGCRVLFMTEEEAKQQNVKDALVWYYTPTGPRLIYVDSEGQAQDRLHLRNTFAIVQALEEKVKVQQGGVAEAQAVKHVYFLGDDINQLIAQNIRDSSTHKKLPFKMTFEQLQDLFDLIQAGPDEAWAAYDEKFSRILPVLKRCSAYQQGIVSTAETSAEDSEAQIAYFEGEQAAADDHYDALKKSIYEDYFFECVKEVVSLRPTNPLSHVGYSHHLQKQLIQEYGFLFSVDRYPVTLGHESPPNRIKTVVSQVKIAFDNQHGENYTKLSEIYNAIAAFKQYLEFARGQVRKGESLFESMETIQAKEDLLNDMEAELVKPDAEPGDKIVVIKKYINTENMETLLNFNKPELNGWLYLKQCIVQLLVACGLYTPEYRQEGNKFVAEIAPELPQFTYGEAAPEPEAAGEAPDAEPAPEPEDDEAEPPVAPPRR